MNTQLSNLTPLLGADVANNDKLYINDASLSGLAASKYIQVDQFLLRTKTYTDTLYATISHNHDASAIVTGLINLARLGTGTPDNTKFLRGDGTWVATGSATSLDSLTDVVLTSPATGHILQYDGANFVNVLGSSKYLALFGYGTNYAYTQVNSTAGTPTGYVGGSYNLNYIDTSAVQHSAFSFGYDFNNISDQTTLLAHIDVLGTTVLSFNYQGRAIIPGTTGQLIISDATTPYVAGGSFIIDYRANNWAQMSLGSKAQTTTGKSGAGIAFFNLSNTAVVTETYYVYAESSNASDLTTRNFYIYDQIAGVPRIKVDYQGRTTVRASAGPVLLVTDADVAGTPTGMNNYDMSVFRTANFPQYGISGKASTPTGALGAAYVLSVTNSAGALTEIFDMNIWVSDSSNYSTRVFSIRDKFANAARITIDSTGNVTLTGAGGVGYGTGAGGTVTQITSKSTGVTLNKICGQITMNGAALAAGAIVSFVLTNSTISATDLIIVYHISGGTPGSYHLNARPAAGSATIDVANRSAGSLSEAIVIGYAVIRSVTA